MGFNPMDKFGSDGNDRLREKFSAGTEGALNQINFFGRTQVPMEVGLNQKNGSYIYTLVWRSRCIYRL